MNLTPKQSAFIDEYIVYRNGAEAARRAGYGEQSARVTASRLLTKANIKAVLDIKKAELALKVEINKVTVIGELRSAIDMAQEKFNADGMISGWIEIAKMLDMYKREATVVAPSAENSVLRAKFEAMSDEDLIAIAEGRVVS